MNIIAFIKHRARDHNCPVCGHSLSTCEVRLLSRGQNQVTVQVTCRHCQVAQLVTVQGRAQLPAPAHPDGTMPKAADPIGSDELIELHRALQQFDGPLTGLLGRPASG